MQRKPQVEAVIKKYGKRFIKLFRLEDQVIVFHAVRAPKDDYHNIAESFISASRVDVYLYYNFKASSRTWTGILMHELLHIKLAPLGCLRNKKKIQACTISHHIKEERIVSDLEHALLDIFKK